MPAGDQFPPPPQANQILIGQTIGTDFPHFPKSFPLGQTGQTAQFQAAGISPDDLAQLLMGLNQSLEDTNPCSVCNWVIMGFTCGLCPFRMLIMGFRQQEEVRSSLNDGKTRHGAVRARLIQQNVVSDIEYYKGDRHFPGGLMFTLTEGALERMQAAQGFSNF